VRRGQDHREVETVSSESVTSIAVLPFVNRSRDEEDEYFSDGLADELIGMLAKIRGLRVSARASSFHFKGKDVPLAEVGARSPRRWRWTTSSVRRAYSPGRSSSTSIGTGPGRSASCELRSS